MVIQFFSSIVSPIIFIFFPRGNKSQYRHLAAVKAKFEAASLLLDDLQLDEDDPLSTRYQALNGVKEELSEARDLLDCRLDLIEKADASSVGWSAAAFYEKSNGLKLKSDSAKLWADAEKAAQAALELKRKDPKPFRSQPTNVGKLQYQRSSQGQIGYPHFLLLFVLCFDICLLDWLNIRNYFK